MERLLIRLWNRRTRSRATDHRDGIVLGRMLTSSGTPAASFVLPHTKRSEHLVILGKTGTGKSSLMRYLIGQDIRAGRGFIHIDLHGDTTPWILQELAREERRRDIDLSDRVIVIEPGDPEYAVGLNPLDAGDGAVGFKHVDEVVQLLKHHWQLQAFGARTLELLLHALLVAVAAGLTLLELGLLLTRAAFRHQCLRAVQEEEIRAYFTERFDTASAAMQTVWREPVLNKLTAFTLNPPFRHILGQRRSTFSVREALDQQRVVLLNLDKGRLGDQATTLGALFLLAIKNALFARQTRVPVSLYADEIQNLVEYDTGLESVLSEARKFQVAICSANQYLDQFPPSMRAAVLSIGTHACFQVSSTDAERMTAAFDGGHHLTTLLKNLPQRQCIVKSGHHRWKHVVVPDLDRRSTDASDLIARSRARWARPRVEIEREIRDRHREAAVSPEERLDDWE